MGGGGGGPHVGCQLKFNHSVGCRLIFDLCQLSVNL